MKTKLRIIITAVAALACVALLGGCASGQANDAKTQNRQYMSSVNSIMSDMEAPMKEFSQAVKDGEVLSLSSQLQSVDDCVERLKAVQAPDAMKDVNDKYVKGAEELQTALKLYVELYQDVKEPKSGSFNYGKYGDRLKDVKSHYDAGIKALEEADKAVAEA